MIPHITEIKESSSNLLYREYHSLWTIAGAEMIASASTDVL